MGKPKNKGKSRNADEDSDTEVMDQQEEPEKPTGKQSKKDKRKKKNDDWEDDIAKELEGLSMEANKDNPDKDVEEEAPPVPAVNKKEKKKKKKQKEDVEDEEDDADGVAVKGNKKKMASFNMLMMDDEDSHKSESEDEKEEEPKQEEVQETKQQKKKDKKKKDKKEKGKANVDEDLDALLAEIDKPTEKTSKKKKGKKGDSQEKDEAVEGKDGEGQDKPEVEKVAPKVVTMEDLEAEDEEEDKKKKKKKKEKEKEDKEEGEGEEKAEDGGEGEEAEGTTVKTAAQKRKEKKEREKKKLAEKKKLVAQKKEGQGEKEGDTEGKTAEDTTAETKEEGAADKKASGDEGEAEEDVKKKKKKKKKGEKEEKEDKEKTKKPNARIKAMQEILRKQKEEEERLQKEEEERIKREEEAIAAAIEKKEEEERKRLEKKERQKANREKLKAEGKLLTAAQKADRKRALEMIEMMKAQGIEIPEKDETEKKKRPVYERKKKKQQKKEDTPTTEGTPSPLDTPASTPMQEEAPAIEKSEVTEQTKSDVAEQKPVEVVEEVKEEWDLSSDEEQSEEKESSPETETKIEIVDKKSSEEPEKEEEEEDEEEEESEEEDDDEEEESESESESDDDDLTPAERAEVKLKKYHEVCEAKRTTDKLRAPVVCVLGHVDTGKTKILDKLRRTNVQDGEAGGITQQIGATNVPAQAILDKTTMCKDFHKKEMKLPGLLIIDTPGHESFSNLRSRGSSLCDIAILVIDIMHGLEPQTIESINLLKEKKTPFVVALNKIDRLYQWKTNPNSDVMNTIKKQGAMTKQEFEERKQFVITQLAEQSLNAALFYENKNPKEYVSLIPTSAHTGDGMGNLLSLICDLTQLWLSKKVSYSEELHSTVMEVKALPGLGTTIDVILVNGKLNEGDQIVLAGTEGPIVTQIRGLLMPQPMRELRVKSQYEHYKEVMAAQGVKIIGKDLEKALAGLPLYVARDEDEVEYYKEEIALALKDVLNSIKLTERGVFVQASTLGSLEALLEFLRTSKIPYAGINIGPVHKRDIMKASIMLEHDAQWAVILAFDVKVERDAQEMADSLGVQIFTADIIYHLQDKFLKFREDLKKQKKDEFQHIAVFPCKLRVLPQHIFNKRDPIVMGVMVEAGIVRLGTPICVPSQEFVELGRITSIEVNHKPQESARRGQEVCIKIENIPGETPKLFGRHFDHNDMLMSKISRNSIDAVKDYFRDEMSKQDWTLMVELKKLFQIL